MDQRPVWQTKAEIAELITRYALLSDGRDWHAAAALFVEDARMSRPTAPDALIVGRDAILRSFLERPPRPTRHVVANVLVTVDGARTARATSQLLLYLGTTPSEGGLPALAAPGPLVGSYADVVVRTDQGWRFQERLGRLDFQPPRTGASGGGTLAAGPPEGHQDR